MRGKWGTQLVLPIWRFPLWIPGRFWTFYPNRAPPRAYRPIYSFCLLPPCSALYSCLLRAHVCITYTLFFRLWGPPQPPFPLDYSRGAMQSGITNEAWLRSFQFHAIRFNFIRFYGRAIIRLCDIMDLFPPPFLSARWIYDIMVVRISTAIIPARRPRHYSPHHFLHPSGWGGSTSHNRFIWASCSSRSFLIRFWYSLLSSMMLHPSRSKLPDSNRPHAVLSTGSSWNLHHRFRGLWHR